MPDVRPRRSVLYMPGANTRALEKARTLPADALIFDLEDAVAPDAKEAARGNVVAAAKSKAYGKREIAIRCNGLGTPWGKADVAAIADVRRRRDPGAQGRERGRCRGHRRAARCGRRAGLDGGMGDDGDAQGHAARRGGRRLAQAADAVRHGHQRPGEGHARAPHADAPADDHRARARHAGGARPRPHHPRRRLQRHPGHRRLQGRVPAGARDGLRRQDADPSQPGRAVQRDLRAVGTPSSRWRARSSRPSRRRRPRARAWSRSTAA